MADKLGLTNEIKEIKLGKSFGKNEHPCFHTFRYDFMPASVDTTKQANVDIGEGNQVTVTVPHITGSGTDNTIFKGSKKPYQKECVLIIDHSTGEITLEKLSCNVQLKKTRAEGRNKFKPNPPLDNSFSNKKSPVSKLSPQQKHQPSFLSQSSPLQKCSPLPKSPVNNHPSPTNNSNPSMPLLLMTNANAATSNQQEFKVPMSPEPEMNKALLSLEPETNKNNTTNQEVVGVMTSSSSSDSSSDDSSDSESSGNEEPNESQEPMQTLDSYQGHINNQGETLPSSQPQKSMPQFNQLHKKASFLKLDSNQQLSDFCFNVEEIFIVC